MDACSISNPSYIPMVLIMCGLLHNANCRVGVGHLFRGGVRWHWSTLSFYRVVSAS